MMKSLLLHATSGTSQDKKRSMPRRCPTPARRPSSSSGDEGSFGRNTSDGYTSGAFNTDEDPYQVGSISGPDGVSETGSRTKLPETPLRFTPSTSRAEVTTPTSGSGYSSSDLQPLSVLRRSREPDVATPSPPRKRRKMLSKPGKVMKDAYFKGIQWTRTLSCPDLLILSTTSSNFIVCCAKRTCQYIPRVPGRSYGTTEQRVI